MKIVYGDITKIKADCIVNAANTQLQHGGGVAKAIARAGGEAIQKESDQIGFCPIGQVVATTAGKLPYKCVIHVPTIDWQTRKKATLEDIFRGVVAALKIAKKKKLKSIAFPLLGAGVVGLEGKTVKKQIAKAAKLFPDSKVILCLKN